MLSQACIHSNLCVWIADRNQKVCPFMLKQLWLGLKVEIKDRLRFDNHHAYVFGSESSSRFQRSPKCIRVVYNEKKNRR